MTSSVTWLVGSWANIFLEFVSDLHVWYTVRKAIKDETKQAQNQLPLSNYSELMPTFANTLFWCHRENADASKKYGTMLLMSENSDA